MYERCPNRKLLPGATGPSDDPPIYVYPKAGKVAASFLKSLACFMYVYVCMCYSGMKGSLQELVATRNPTTFQEAIDGRTNRELKEIDN